MPVVIIDHKSTNIIVYDVFSARNYSDFDNAKIIASLLA